MWTKTANRPHIDVKAQLFDAVIAPIKAFRREYWPPVLIYFAYAAYSITAVAESFWIKGALKLTPAELAGLSVWLTLPWAIKMVFGELVDTVKIFGSQRRSYVLIGACLSAIGLVLIAGAAGGWLTFASKDQLYTAAKIIAAIGVVLQDVVADAITTEVVPRVNPDGTPRPEEAINGDLAMVQIIGRLAVSAAAFLVAAPGGYLASAMSYDKVFLLALVIPVLSVVGAFLAPEGRTEPRPTDWRILGGGIVFGGFVIALGLLSVPRAQEITFLVSLAVIGAMLWLVTRTLTEEVRRRIFFAAIIIFAFRATPGIGAGYGWYAIDVLKFDEAFQGWLDQIGTTLQLISLWIFAVAVSRMKVTTVLLWLTVAGAVLSIPALMLVFGVHEWTEKVFGFGARSIAVVDAAASSPFGALGMIPLLTLVAIYAPDKQRAVWFALMSSFMNLALVASEIGTKYLNQIYTVERGSYGELPALFVTASIISTVVPLVAILLFRRRVDR